MDRFKKAVDDHYKLHLKYRKLGAEDTEPMWQFENQMRNMVSGKEFKPLSERGWELYSSMKESEAASEVLNKSVETIYKLFNNLKISERNEAIDYLSKDFYYVDLKERV